jgi:hypothetical protein
MGLKEKRATKVAQPPCAKDADAVLLSFEGLQREKTKGTISYILSLPVVRSELLFSPLTVDVAEILALGIVPVLLVPALSPAVHQHYPVGRFFCLLP